MRRIGRLALRWVYAMLLALDVLTSALFFGAPLQTISARLGKYRQKGDRAARIGANLVDAAAEDLFGQHKHCDGALAAYEAREKVASSWSG